MELEDQVVTLAEVHELLHQERQQAEKRFRATTTGAALAFSAIMPGLGMLFLRWYKWALIYFGLSAVLVYAARHSPSERSGLYGILCLVWLVNVIHSGLAADLSADRMEGRD